MKKRVLAITSGTIHPKFWARRKLLSFIVRGGYDIVQSGTIESASSLDRSFSAVILYLHRRKLSDRALEALMDFVSSGGGLLAIHSATASFKQCGGYFSLLGGRFLSHEKIAEFGIVPAERGSDVFGDIGPFRVRDELYVHEVSEGITVHFYAESGSGREPMVWTKILGKGRICYIGPGHCTSTISNPGFQKVIMKGLDWVSSSMERR